MKHTPEPWSCDAYVGSDEYDDPDTPFVQIGTNRWLPTTLSIPCAFQEHADAERIVACVNACAGLEDPVKEIAKLRGTL